MGALPIDFANSSPTRAVFRTSPASVAGIATGVLLIVTAMVAWQKLPAPAKPAPLPIVRKPAPTTSVTAAQAEAINRAVMQLNLPWRDLFNALEAATPASIALIELSPDARSRRLSGKAEAADANAMLDYLARLQQQPFFTQVLLTRHEQQSDPTPRPLRFSFDVRWQEPRP